MQIDQLPPPSLFALRIKPKLSSLAYTLYSEAPARLSASPPHKLASQTLSCLQFPSCLRLSYSSHFCLHHTLCLECPSLNLHLANTFLSFPRTLHLNCPCICLSPRPHQTVSLVMALVPSYHRDRESTAAGIGSHSQLGDSSEPLHFSEPPSPSVLPDALARPVRL